jgi:N,N'-diacetyllegionaminate synthase
VNNYPSVVVIAEAGVNHNGNYNRAKSLVDAAADVGADVVKFQAFKTENMVTKMALKAGYQKKMKGSEVSQYQMLKDLELSGDAHKDLAEYCQYRNIEFMSSPFDVESAYMLLMLGLPRFKIASGEITNLPLLRVIGGFGRPIFLSSGMSELDEVNVALEVLEVAGTKRSMITVLQCNTEYPTPVEDVNLRAMISMRQDLGVDVGYSDHTLGADIPLAAVALGATVIEKHLTLDRTLPGPDHSASLEVDEFEEMIRGIRRIEAAMGDKVKRPTKSERPNIELARKSIVAARPINKGESFSTENLACKRPATGLSPMLWDKIIGIPAKKYFCKDEPIEI